MKATDLHKRSNRLRQFAIFRKLWYNKRPMITLAKKPALTAETGRGEEGTAEDARRLLHGWGAAPLLYFALLADKRYLFSEPGEPEWGIAYRVQGRQALALGDPFGDPAATPAAIAAYLKMCRRQGWKPVWYQTTPDHLDFYAKTGLQAVKVGEDAQVALSDFSLAGKKYVKLRNDLRRIEKAGVVLEAYGPDAPPPASCIAEMDAISAGWREAHHANEGWFAMGGFDPNSRLFAESRYFVARDTNTNQMLAFASFVPAFRQGWTLDLMRRQAETLHGVMDFLIVSAATQFASEGAQRLSLGLSPLAGADDAAESAATSSVRRFLYTRLNSAYNFQGLHAFKDKFATRWEPRYLLYSGSLALASASCAVLKAHLTPPDAVRTVRVWNTRPARTLAAACALLLVGLMPLEKTLAQEAVTHSRIAIRHFGVRYRSLHSLGIHHIRLHHSVQA